MGLGSRFSKWIEHNLLEKFVWIEFSLSLIASNVTNIVYVFFAIYGTSTFIIYTLSVIIGLFIGMEIPLVIRLNEKFQNLKVNVSSAMEKDYYGSLAGGIFFAFIGLPHLGLTYTPLVLGSINFAVALVLVVVIWSEIEIHRRNRFVGYALIVLTLLALSGFYSQDIISWGDKIRYKDPIVYSGQSKYQKIVMTYSQGDYWLFLNGHQQLSTFDEALYHEPLIHPVVKLHQNPRHVLVLGGGDGAAVRELLKYEEVEQITLVDIDPNVTDLARSHPILLSINKNSLNHPKVEVINQDGFTFLEDRHNLYDIIVADFPDPRTVDLGRLYSKEFYWLCFHSLKKNGLMVTQAGSPYYAQRAFECINQTMQVAGFYTLLLHNQVPTLGEWGWVIGSKELRKLKTELQQADLGELHTQWLTNESLTLISSFGKQVLNQPVAQIQINQIHDPVLYRYYLKGRWDLY